MRGNAACAEIGSKPSSNTRTTTPARRLLSGMLSLWLLAFSISNAPSQAAPPNGADPDSPLGQWYKSLQAPHTGKQCCSISDCRPVLAREKNGRWEVYLENALSETLELGNGRWVTVPEDVILKRENLDGRPIA